MKPDAWHFVGLTELRLALRHPQMTGASRQLILEVIEGIEQLFKAKGMPQDECVYTHLIESEETAKLREADETAIESIDNWNESEKRASFSRGFSGK